MVLNFVYPEFKGSHYCSWSIDGYPRQENRLIIWTEKGQLILTGSVGVFVSNSGEVDISHQLDFDVGFNLAPDYAGAGFTNELRDLKDAVLKGQRAVPSRLLSLGFEFRFPNLEDALRDVTARGT